MKSNSIFKKELKEKFISICCPKIGDDGKYHFIYKIEFPNGKYYLGEHTTSNLNDGYCGSGSLLPFEFEKCSINDVKKTILSFHNSKKEMELNEEKIIGNLYKTDKQCLNLIKGGSKGFNEHIIEKSVNSRKGKKRTKESIEKQRISCTGKHHTEETKKKQSEWHKSFWNTIESNDKRQTLRKLGKNKIITDELRKKISDGRKKFNNSDYGKNINRYRYYTLEVENSEYKEKINYLIEKSKKEKLLKEENEFLSNFWDFCKKNRLKNRLSFKKSLKEKYIFTEEHKKHLSDSKKGKKLSFQAKEKMSQSKTGRKNPRYIPNKIQMLNTNEDVIKTFNDCIEAVEFVRKNINEKATSTEIFIACRKNKIRYNHKWKMIV